MKSTYETFPLGLRLSHLALLRNLDQFAKLSHAARGLVVDFGAQPSVSPEHAAEYIAWYVDFLDVHHRGEDEQIFPALRRHTAGRTTDAAHLDIWRHEHEAIYRMGENLRDAGRKLGMGAQALQEVQRLALDLKTQLVPHLKAEEDVLTPQHLKEMIPEKELQHAQLAIPRSQGIHAVRMANFFVHSLEPEEQRALLGETPWLFRKVILGKLGNRRARRFGGLMPVREVNL